MLGLLVEGETDQYVRISVKNIKQIIKLILVVDTSGKHR